MQLGICLTVGQLQPHIWHWPRNGYSNAQHRFPVLVVFWLMTSSVIHDIIDFGFHLSVMWYSSANGQTLTLNSYTQSATQSVTHPRCRLNWVVVSARHSHVTSCQCVPRIIHSNLRSHSLVFRQSKRMDLLSQCWTLLCKVPEIVQGKHAVIITSVEVWGKVLQLWRCAQFSSEPANLHSTPVLLCSDKRTCEK